MYDQNILIEHLTQVLEALERIPNRFKSITKPDIPLRDVMTLRNVLAHVYFEVDKEQIYSICNEDVAPLISVVRTIIKDLEGNQKGN